MKLEEKIRLIADGEFEVVAKLSVDETTQICRDLRGARYSLDIACQQRDDNYHRAENLLAQRDELLAALNELWETAQFSINGITGEYEVDDDQRAKFTKLLEKYEVQS